MRKLNDFGDKALNVHYRACELDPWYFMTRFCYTLDSHDTKTPIKQFPDYQYLEDLTRDWEREPKLAVVKSRQVMVSWWGVAINFWLAFFHTGVLVFLMSKKEEDANFLLDRAKIIYDYLPIQWRTAFPVNKSYCKIEISSRRSLMMALPSGSDQIRMHTATSIFMDEFAFQDNQRKNITASLPSVRNGGKLAVVSTPNGHNHFEKVVFDKTIDEESTKHCEWKKYHAF